MYLNFRTIGKFALILVVIGFCMPMFSIRGQIINGFQFAGLCVEAGSSRIMTILLRHDDLLYSPFEAGDPPIITALFIYVSFLLAFIRLIIGVFLRNMPIFIDWLVIIVIGLAVSPIIQYPFIIAMNFATSPLIQYPVRYLSGAYVIIIAWIVALAALLVSEAKEKSILWGKVNEIC